MSHLIGQSLVVVKECLVRLPTTALMPWGNLSRDRLLQKAYSLKLLILRRAMNISATSNSSFVDGRFYLYTQLATGISLMILSPITVISNLLLLLTIYKDPLKCFHTPASYLIIALCCVDFTAGLVMEPLFIAYRLASYLKWSLYPGRSYVRLLRIESSISIIGLNLSFLLVLALIWTQFLAITHPQRYRSAITTRRILVFVGISTLYFTGFTLLQFIR